MAQNAIFCAELRAGGLLAPGREPARRERRMICVPFVSFVTRHALPREYGPPACAGGPCGPGRPPRPRIAPPPRAPPPNRSICLTFAHPPRSPHRNCQILAYGGTDGGNSLTP